MALKEQQTSFLSHVEQYFKNNCMGVLEKFLAREVLSPQAVDLSGIKSILVIRQHDQLGDFLLATPVLRALRERFPNARIGVLVREYFYDVARSLPYVDEVLVFYENSLHWTLKRASSLVRQLRKGWDLTVVLNTVSHSFTSDFFAHLSGARYILGSGDRVFSGCTRNFFYNLIAPHNTTHRHQTERNLDIVRYIGVDTQNLALAISLSDMERRNARLFLEQRGFKSDSVAIGMHIGAGKPENRWPVQCFAQLAGVLTLKHNAQIVLFWGPYEEDLSRIFCEYVSVEPINIGHTDLKTLASLLALCDAVICNDSGIMHLAAATGVPMVALFGPTDPAEWKPLGSSIAVLQPESKKVEDVKVEDVMKALENFIRKN
ncbi:MAG: glycosyltransferase family 9 protein [Ignavibacteriae bacterium]|nr:glycosyltransferase family 9 protein [Ignavibacteriota bacterium]